MTSEFSILYCVDLEEAIHAWGGTILFHVGGINIAWEGRSKLKNSSSYCTGMARRADRGTNAMIIVACQTSFRTVFCGLCVIRSLSWLFQFPRRIISTQHPQDVLPEVRNAVVPPYHIPLHKPEGAAHVYLETSAVGKEELEGRYYSAIAISCGMQRLRGKRRYDVVKSSRRPLAAANCDTRKLALSPIARAPSRVRAALSVRARYPSCQWQYQYLLVLSSCCILSQSQQGFLSPRRILRMGAPKCLFLAGSWE